jgi:hypothetical protein
MLITNETQEITVKNIANNILPDCDEVFFEVGYFYFSGFEQIYKRLKDVKIKILIGINYDEKIASAVISNNFFGTVVNPELHPDYPTQFVGAYRSALSSNLAPTLPDPVANARMRQRHGVETTLLRTNDLGGAAAALTNTPMLLNRPGAADHVNVTQPYDFYQRAIRMPNLVSNQSNVFAVWVTVGLFEYDPLTGYGEEYVNEAGGVQR